MGTHMLRSNNYLLDIDIPLFCINKIAPQNNVLDWLLQYILDNFWATHLVY